MQPPAVTAPRYSHERAAIDRLQALIEVPAGVETYSGTKPSNRLAVDGWDLVPKQYIQFGDLRYQSEALTVVVEVESGGGVGNLVKYWPLLQGALGERPFYLLHLFQLGSDNDFIVHRKLWSFLTEQMRADLEHRGRPWGTRWAAEIGTYRRRTIDADMLSHARRLRDLLLQGLQDRYTEAVSVTT